MKILSDIAKVVKDGLKMIVEIPSDAKSISTYGSTIVINGDSYTIDDKDCKTIEVIVNGNVGSVDVSAGNVTINGNVEGDVDVSCGNVSCGNIAGDIDVSCGNITTRK